MSVTNSALLLDTRLGLAFNSHTMQKFMHTMHCKLVNNVAKGRYQLCAHGSPLRYNFWTISSTPDSFQVHNALATIIHEGAG